MMNVRESARARMVRQYPRGKVDLNLEFRCLHCRNFVPVDGWIAGVRHRNHCPYCLWSRHLDLFHAGDRMAACKAGMQPIALSIKQTEKKYAREEPGELMLVHRCTECGKISLNRIAADDDTGRILETFARSCRLQQADRKDLSLDRVRILTESDGRLVQSRLCGRN